MRISWFIPVNNTNYNKMPASVWIRCLQLIPYLESRGIHSTINQFDKKSNIYVFLRRQDKEAEVLARQVKEFGGKVVVDLVVNYFDKATLPRLGSPVTEKHIKQTARMLKLADAVTCASQFITERASNFHKQAVYIPDSIDCKVFSYKKATGDFYRKNIRAIWSGIVSKAYELEAVLPILQKYNIQLKIISNKPPVLKRPDWSWFPLYFYRFKKWKYETFPQEILGGEICLSPRFIQSPYNMGHSFFKIGVFMAQGVPAICSPVPSYYEVLNQNKGGLICSMLQDWDVILRRVTEERELLVRWSNEARESLKAFTTEKIAQEYIDLFSKLAK